MIYLVLVLLSFIFFLNGCGNRYVCNCRCNGAINNTNSQEPEEVEIDKSICSPDVADENYNKFCKVCENIPEQYCIVCPEGETDPICQQNQEDQSNLLIKSTKSRKYIK